MAYRTGSTSECTLSRPPCNQVRPHSSAPSRVCCPARSLVVHRYADSSCADVQGYRDAHLVEACTLYRHRLGPRDVCTTPRTKQAAILSQTGRFQRGHGSLQQSEYFTSEPHESARCTSRLARRCANRWLACLSAEHHLSPRRHFRPRGLARVRFD